MLRKLVIVGCGKTKRNCECPAKDLYTGQLFRLARSYAELHGDAWLIASANYGLLEPSRVIPPYERTLEGLSPDDIRQFGFWCQADLARFFKEMCVRELHGRWQDPPAVVFLAGKRYIDAICKWTFLKAYPELVETPLEGMGIGKRLAWLKRQVEAGRQGRGSVQPANPDRQHRAENPAARSNQRRTGATDCY